MIKKLKFGLVSRLIIAIILGILQFYQNLLLE